MIFFFYAVTEPQIDIVLFISTKQNREGAK